MSGTWVGGYDQANVEADLTANGTFSSLKATALNGVLTGQLGWGRRRYTDKQFYQVAFECRLIANK
jgi:hypothetical protein